MIDLLQFEAAARRAFERAALPPLLLYAPSGEESAGANCSAARVAAERYGILHPPLDLQEVPAIAAGPGLPPATRPPRPFPPAVPRWLASGDRPRDVPEA